MSDFIVAPPSDLTEREWLRYAVQASPPDSPFLPLLVKLRKHEFHGDVPRFNNRFYEFTLTVCAALLSEEYGFECRVWHECEGSAKYQTKTLKDVEMAKWLAEQRNLWNLEEVEEL